MVNAPSSAATADRRDRPRASAEHAPALGATSLNPFGDLVALQHLSARFAKSLKSVFESHYRGELRCWAEPLVVQRFSDYRAERPEGLTGWQPIAMGTAKVRAQLVFGARMLLEMLDCFFGGAGEVGEIPAEFSPATEALATRFAAQLCPLLESAWEPLTRIAFQAERPALLAALPDLGGDEAVVVTRFGLAAGNAKPQYCDLLYPVAALKPVGPALAPKVHGPVAEPEPQWRAGLTRAVMQVKLPVRSVLAEPEVPLTLLLDLKPGDVIPIELSTEVPVMVADRRLGTGLVGTANGRAAVRLTSIEPITEEDLR